MPGRRIVILCEGDTEELAIKNFVRKKWLTEDRGTVSLQPIKLKGKLEHIGRKAPLYLGDPEVLAVFTLIDLYGMHRVQHSPQDSLEAKVQQVQSWCRGQFQHLRANDFYPHLGVHETEAWLLAEGVALARRIGDPDLGPDPQAESKDFQRPPSKRIDELFLRHKKRSYQKKLDGGPLFAGLQFQPVYDSCRYFRSFYDDLRNASGLRR